MVEITIENLTKKYGDLTALDNVSLKISSSQVFGLLGPNGAGKSTLLKTLVGILKPTSGTVSVKGFDIVKDPEMAKKIIGYLPENPSLYTGLTTQEFLGFVGKIRGVKDDRLGREISEALVLDEPLTALDPKTRVSVKEWIASQTKKGVTTILSTHELDVAEDYADMIAIIDKGKIVAMGGIVSLRKIANVETDARLEDVFLRLTAEVG